MNFLKISTLSTQTESAKETGSFVQSGGRRNLYSVSNSAFPFTDLIM
jgi:hypothetical protein